MLLSTTEKKRQQEIIRMTLSNAAHKAEKKIHCKENAGGRNRLPVTFHHIPLSTAVAISIV